MIRHKQLSAVTALLLGSAGSKGTVSFPTLFALFPDGVEKADIWDTLEAAEGEIADRKEAIFSALMAKRDTGLPGDGFFDTYRLLRGSEYAAISGKKKSLELTLEEEREITRRERLRVSASKSTHPRPTQSRRPSLLAIRTVPSRFIEDI